MPCTCHSENYKCEKRPIQEANTNQKETNEKEDYECEKRPIQEANTNQRHKWKNQCILLQTSETTHFCMFRSALTFFYIRVFLHEKSSIHTKKRPNIAHFLGEVGVAVQQHDVARICNTG